jgi:hypothetical protein
MQIAVKPEHNANYAGRAKPKCNVESVHNADIFIMIERGKLLSPFEMNCISTSLGNRSGV